MLRFVLYCFWIYTAVLLLFPVPVRGQTRLNQAMRMGRLGIEDGLSQGMVFCMFQDSRGFMWFGTKEGLNRYDGHHFKVYRKRPGDTTSLADNHVYAITEDRRGRLWIATRGAGLIMFDPALERFTQIPLTIEGSDTRVRCVEGVEMDGKGRLWVSVLNSRLICLDTQLENPLSIAASAHFDGPVLTHDNQEVIRLRRDILGRLTFLAGQGLFHLDEERDIWELKVKWAPLFEDIPEAGKFVCSTVTSDSSIWVSAGILGSSRIVRLSPDGSTVLSVQQFRIGQDALYVRDMLEGPDGMLYIASVGSIVRYDYSNGTYIAAESEKDKQGGYSGRANHLYHNREGIVWISTSGYGINTFDPLTLAFHSRPERMNEALFGKELRAFDRHIRNNSGGLMQLVNDTYPLRMDDGSVWCGSRDHGLLYYDARSGEVRQFGMNSGDPYSFLLIRVNRPFVDSRDRVWIGNRHGISRLDTATGEWEHFWYESDGPDLTAAEDIVTAYHEAPDGSFWLGTLLHGLARFTPDSGKFTFFSYDSGDSSSISHDHVLTLEADPHEPDRFLWIGTDGGGLNRFDFTTGRFTRYGTEQGLPNSVVYGILTDEAKDLWMSTNQGLCRMDPRSGHIRRYDVRDGLQGNEFNRTEFQRIGDSLCFGGVNGYNLFYPPAIRNNTLVPPVVLTGLRLFNTPAAPGAPDSPLSRAMPYTETIRLSHDQNMISIEFAALDYHAPDRNRYRYRLEGFTNGWIDAGTDRVATFTNLDPGVYVFHVTGSNNHGVWNSEGATLRIVIDPPWWLTIWAFVSYAVLIIGALLIIDRLQRQRIIAREREQSQFREAKLRADAAELEARIVRAENERKHKEMQVASVIQQRVLPQQLPHIPGYDLAGINLPAEEIGGDYYDCIALRDGRLAMVVADVTGKGVPASLLVNSLHAALRIYLDHDEETSSLVRRLNAFLYESTPPNAFITFLLAVLDPETGELEIMNAGHNPALLQRNGSVEETLRSRHLPLGCTSSPASYQSEYLTLAPGEGLLLFTDGITEAMNAQREPFGQDTLEELIVRHRTQRSAMLLGNVVSELKHYAKGTEQSDDITALFIRREIQSGSDRDDLMLNREAHIAVQ